MKSPTDLHWSQRAESVKDDAEVNIMDVFQRNLEYDHVGTYLKAGTTLLEVGCGNGFSTDRFRKLVGHVDAFDYSETMIARAKAAYGELNNRFIHDNVLDPKHLSGPYDTVLCIRVLINLRNLEEQRLALRNLMPLVRDGGRFILLEGFRDGFRGLNTLRTQVGLPAVTPAAINCYTDVAELLPELSGVFSIEARFHLGAYDYLTRVFYPLLVGADEVRHNTVFSERSSELARAFNPEDFESLSRVQGFVLRKRA